MNSLLFNLYIYSNNNYKKYPVYWQPAASG